MANRTLKELLAPYPANVQTLALSTRAFVLGLLPKAEESVDPTGPYVSYGYGAGYKGIICFMTISKSGVKLGLLNGAELSDPEELLRGGGKSARHVPLETTQDLRQAALKQLVKQSAKLWQMRQTAQGK